ncbi:hypothetical protein GH714_011393 [Hevea brasiliensis]|uniref:Uncharacterized protein n=1 Tax=Hevea brasiliensis TaxID=3981 RepID=A0A6A6M7X5_HEVBR|nr:hypothetical protein GH714_011393 [Hevea brasiliensis]
MDVDCLQVIKHEVYQENEVDSIEIKEDELHLLLRINVDPEDIESLLISKLPEGDEDDNFIDDVETDDLDDPLVFYKKASYSVKNKQPSLSSSHFAEHSTSGSSNHDIRGMLSQARVEPVQGISSMPNDTSLEMESEIPNPPLNESSSLITTSTSRKRGRGQTMGKGLMKTIAVMGTRMKITVNPEIGQPNNGDESA